MTRFQRLSALLDRLRSTTGMTVLELAEELGSDRRTIQRDLRYLTSCGHPVGRTRNKHRRYFLHCQGQPVEIRPFWWCFEADFLPELGRALLERRRLRILYRGDHTLRLEWLEVEPHQLFFEKIWQLRAYHPGERVFQVHLLERIRDWEVLEASFSPQESSLWHDWDRQGGEAIEVDCQVSQSLALRLRDQPVHPSQRLDGNRLALRVSYVEGLLDWMLAQNYCRVLEPEWLRLRFAERVALLQT